MSGAKTSSCDAVGRAVKAHAGYRTVSVFPSLTKGRLVADVTLEKGDEWGTVSENMN